MSITKQIVSVAFAVAFALPLAVCADEVDPEYTFEYDEDNPTCITGIVYEECPTELEIPDDVAEIAEGALSGLEALTSVSIPDSVKVIGGWAFAECENLWDDDGGWGLEYVGEGAFDDTPFLTGIDPE